MPAKLIAVYRTPKDKAAFDAYYFATHAPLAKKIPGLLKYDVSTGSTGSDNVHLIATLYFESRIAIEHALGTPEGQETAGDLANFAEAGVDLYIFDTREI